MTARVLVIVVTHNGMRWIDRCIGSVISGAKTADSAPEVAVYVWDNASTDGSADYVAEHFPQAVLVRSQENLGFSIPNNKGFEYAIREGFDYVYLLNQDAWLEPGALEKLVAAAESHPEYGVLSPLQMTDGYQDLDRQFAKRLPVKPAMTSRPAPSSCPAPTGHLIDVPFIMAAHWLVPLRAVEKIGPFEEELFPLYGQDDEWCRRLHFSGLKVGVIPEARAVHDRQYREEPLEWVVYRNYYTGSLVRLCDVSRPLFEKFSFVIFFTLVKAVKYRSLLPFKYFRQICRDLPRVRKQRSIVRTRAHNAK